MHGNHGHDLSRPNVNPFIKIYKVTKSETTKLWRHLSLQQDHNKEKCMKRVTSILAVLALSTAANAADTVDMKWNAEMRTRYTNDAQFAGKKEGGNYNGFAQRNKLGLHLTKGENFQGHVSLVNNFFWGSSALRSGTRNNYMYGTPDTVVASTNNNNVLAVNEAYGWWKASDMASLKFGRSSMEIAGGYVSSSQDWLATPYAFDGMWSMWDFEPVSLNVFATKLHDANTVATSPKTNTMAGNSDPEAVMYGAVLGIKNLPEMLKKAEIHLLQTNDEATNPAYRTGGTTGFAAAADNLRTENLRYGLFLGGDHMGWDYHAAADLYNGKTKHQAANTSTQTDYNLSGSMFDLGLGYSFPEMMMLKISANYHMDSGGDAPNGTSVKDFKTYRPFYYDDHNLGAGLLDAVTWGNLTFWSVSAGVKPSDDLGVNLTYTKMSRSSDKDTVSVYGFAAGATSTTALTSSNDIGSEIDFSVNKTYGDNFSIWALYGVFTPGDLVKEDNAYDGATIATAGSSKEENHTRIQIQGKLTF